MELKEVLGNRRSIRYFDPDRPVEREKIQRMLEAMRIASCAVNAHWLRCVVVEHGDLSEDEVQSLMVPTALGILELSPIGIYCFCDLGTVQRNEGSRLKELVDVGALNPSHGWSHKFVDEVVYPQILKPMSESPFYFPIAAFDCGGAATQGLLVGVEQGLGCCWTAFNPEGAKKIMDIPDDWAPLYVLNVGYPLESPDGGGQRPRPDFETLYFERRAGQPFPRDPAVVKELEEAKLFQPPAPLPGRKEEVRAISRKLGLPE